MSDYSDEMFGKKAPPKEKVEATLERAHDIRKFEIGLYWQRALYFWGFQAAVFIAFSGLYDKQATFLLSLMAFTGLVLAIAWYYVAKGGKAWQENWERHIDLLENNITGKLHKTIIGKKGEFYSVSKINKFVIGFIGVMWGVVLLFLFFRDFFWCELQCLENWLPIILFVIAILIWLVGYYCCWKSGVREKVVNFNENGNKIND